MSAASITTAGFVGAGNWAIRRAHHFASCPDVRVGPGWSRREASRQRYADETGAPATDD